MVGGKTVPTGGSADTLTMGVVREPLEPSLGDLPTVAACSLFTPYTVWLGRAYDKELRATVRWRSLCADANRRSRWRKR